jgi:multicomponent Na+:H+ antiporter subunit E
VFLDVFRITLTPLTIALGLEAGGSSYRVHRLEER